METVRNDCVTPRPKQGGILLGEPEADLLATSQLGPVVRQAIGLGRAWLLGQQQADGHFVAELEGDSILQSEYILLLAFLGREKSDLARRAAERLVQTQLPEGGWSMYPGGRVEISGTVKAYFALKLTGHDPSAEYMERARRAVLAHGGADAVNSYTRFYLALLGQISYEHCPAVPPEVMLAPKWFPANLYAVSAWSRTIIVPLSIMWAHRPVRPLEPRQGIRELFRREPEDWPPLRCPDLPGGTGFFSWDHFFRRIDRALKWCERHRVLPLRRRALKKAEQWMLARFQGSDGLGAIFPPIIWSIVALRCLGYADDSPEAIECHRQLEALILEDDESDAIRLQPCKSPVWDTALSIRSLTAAGVRPERAEMGRAVDWLLEKQILKPGDWSETVRAEPGGWAFEYANDFYPDSDDTAIALSALQSLFEPPAEGGALPADLHVADCRWAEGDAAETDPEEHSRRLARSSEAIRRGLAWMLAMQNDDGGWGAFDRNNNRRFLCYVPFADHNAMIDPSTPDLTGHVLGALGELGRRVGDPAVDRAVEYLRRTQEANGSWFGRWGVNYIYGTGEAMTGLAAVGLSPEDLMIRRGANWLLACQQPGGGWGESADSYEQPERAGQGPATPSQTAWAIMGLLAAGLEHHAAVTRGVQFLVDRQAADGSWDEPEVTGTGVPRVFYLRYHYYPIYFPLLALSRWAVTAAGTRAQVSRPPLRVVTADGLRRPHALATG